MTSIQIVSWSVGAIACVGALYGLHRLALRLEERGLIYYRNKRGSASAVGSFVALHKTLEPQANHVLTIRDEIRRDVGDATGPDA